MKRLLIAGLLALVSGCAAQGGMSKAQKARDAALAARVQVVCANCHLPTILEGKHYSADKWGEVTDQMISRGAPVTDEEYDALVGYLARVYGPGGR